MPRTVAHLDLDAFFASVELLRRPELRGRPVVVCRDSPRAVVTTCTYEARAFGVRSAMPLSEARRRCPQAVLVDPDLDAYREVSAAVMAILREEIEAVEPAGLDEAYLELSELVSPRAAMRRIVARIADETGMRASVGIGPNKLVAKLASDMEKPAGFVVLDRRGAWRRLADGSPGVLPGIGPRTAEGLRERGVHTIRQLAAVSEAELVAWHGPRSGRWLWRRCRFDDDAAVLPHRDPVSESRETTFAEDLDHLPTMEEALLGLTARLCEGVRGGGWRGRTVGIKVRLADFTTVTRARTLPAAVDDEATIGRVACELLRAYAPAQPVRLLGVRLAGLVGEGEGPGGQLALPLDLPVAAGDGRSRGAGRDAAAPRVPGAGSADW